MDAEQLLEGLNDAQRAAVTSTAAPLCVLAGAGSGKTRVLTRRIAWRAATGDLDPRHVLALTFTRKAAGELTTRLRALELRDKVAAGTFHALAYAQLRARWADRGVQPPTLLDRKVGFVARLVPNGARTLPLDLVTEIEWAKARALTPDDYPAAGLAAGRQPPLPAPEVAEIFGRYEHEKRQRRLVDFDDLLRLCRRDLLADREFAAAQRWRFQHVFVDEYQDVNPLQQQLLDAWLGDTADLCVVGDPAQAIYAWNGSDPTLLERFAERHPSAEVVRLTENYRSSPEILTVANAVLAGGGNHGGAGALRPNRPEGPIPSWRGLADDRAEARAVARALRDRQATGLPWSDQAVLVRTNAQLAVLEEALSEVGIPFRVRGGGALLDQAEVKAALRDLQSSRGDFAIALVDLETAVATAAGGGAGGGPAGDETAAGGAAAERAANLAALVRLAHDYAGIDPRPSIAGFVGWLNATTRGDRPDRDGNAVELATFHAAKGLEWPIVHLAGLEKGLVPIGHAKTDGEQAEELRLFYVAITRAQRELLGTWAEHRTFANRTVAREPSPYLQWAFAATEALGAGTVPDDWVAALARPSTAPAARAAPNARGARRARAAASAGARPTTDLDDEGRAVLDALKAWRLDRARAASVPAYVIFNDRTLEAVAATQPRTHDDLLALPGLGPVKVQRFGDDLLGVVATHGAG